MWPTSASRPSETSIIAVAPSSAATGPAASGGSGSRYAPTTAAGERNPRDSTASPAAAQPSRPATASTSPGRAPSRCTARPPRRSPSTVTAMVSTSDLVRSPPTTPAPSLLGHLVQPDPDTQQRVPPLRSAVRTARPRTPSAPPPSRRCRRRRRARPGDRSARRTPSRCGNARRRPACPMLITTRPSAAATMAASSPGPSSVVAGCPRPVVIASMSANSPMPLIGPRGCGRRGGGGYLGLQVGNSISGEDAGRVCGSAGQERPRGPATEDATGRSAAVHAAARPGNAERLR